MKRATTLALILTLCFTVALSAGIFAQVKKDSKTGLDRITGTIQNINKDKTLTVTQTGNVKGTWKVSYTDSTKITERNADAKAASLKEGQRVIVLGKYEKDVLVASRIDIRN
jgi:hypothetical protein